MVRCRVALYAARDLQAGVELTFDYNTDHKTFQNNWADEDGSSS
jgi:SET domain-containing protein